MKEPVLALLALELAACSGNADIGVDMNPITCMPAATAEVAGTVRNPADGAQLAFDHATPFATLGAPQAGQPMLQLSSNLQTDMQRALILRFSFRCGATQIADYGVIGDGQTQQLHCPLEVPTAMLGSIEYLPAASGVMIVDENANCLAGRFRVDFGDNGAVGGWFSAPWQ
jgi:hypothetical protein